MGFLNIYPVIIETTSTLKSYNFYIVQDGDNTILIDAGVNTDECWREFQAVLAENNLTIEQIDFIVLTHSHVDHIGLINRIMSYVDIPVYAHPKALRHLRRDEALLLKRITFFEHLFKELDCGKNGEKRVKFMREAFEKNKSQTIEAHVIPIKDGDKIGRFEVIDTPGHASDHISLYDPTEKILFSGDNLFSHMNSNALTERDENNELYPSLLMHEATLEKLNNLSLATVYPGHGTIISEPHDVISARLNTIVVKGERIVSKIGENKMTVSELAKAIYGRLYDTMFHFIISEVIGQLGRLQSHGIVDYTIDNGIRYYYVK